MFFIACPHDIYRASQAMINEGHGAIAAAADLFDEQRRSPQNQEQEITQLFQRQQQLENDISPDSFRGDEEVARALEVNPPVLDTHVHEPLRF